MGEFHRAEFAYMVPVFDGVVPEGDPDKPTIPSIYRVKVSQVKAFKAQYDKWGAVWVPIYNLHNATDFLALSEEAMRPPRKDEHAEPQREPAPQEEDV